MTETQQKLYDAINAYDEDRYAIWNEVVKATHNLAAEIERKESSYDASFPPELLRQIDSLASKTAWMYNMIERAAKSKRNTCQKIRRACGYTG